MTPETTIAQDAQKRPYTRSEQKPTDEPTEIRGRATGQGRRPGGDVAGVPGGSRY